MSTRNVTLRFPSLVKLWDFRRAIDVNIFEMNLLELTITCDCTEKHIELAVNEFGGKVYEREKMDNRRKNG